SIFIEETNIFNILNGEVIKCLGNLKNAKVLILEPNRTLNTRRIRSTPNYMETKLKNKDLIKEAFCLLEDGIRKNDLNLVGKACNISSLANENIHQKVGLKEIIEISKNYGAYGVNIAHSGTVVGILLDKSMDEKRLIELIRNENLHKFYKKIYASDIIDGGIRGGTQWNTLKIL
ncbi:MAG: cobalamin biosynthesis protein, partial [Peptostreptococcaceae bacterium]